MSPEQQAANTTRGLSKLSKEQEKEAKKGNKGQHDANAGGHAREKDPAPAMAQQQVATEQNPTPTSSRKGKEPELQPEPDYHGDTERQPPLSMSEEPPSNEHLIIGDIAPMNHAPLDHLNSDFNAEFLVPSPWAHETMPFQVVPAYPSHNPLPFDAWGESSSSTQPHSTQHSHEEIMEIMQWQPEDNLREYYRKIGDYRSVTPATEEDRQGIQDALCLTRKQYREVIGHEAQPTSQKKCYLEQWWELYASFRLQYGLKYGPATKAPDLVKCATRWPYGFMNHEDLSGGEEAYLTFFNERQTGGEVNEETSQDGSQDIQWRQIQ